MLGRYGEIASSQLDGSNVSTGRDYEQDRRERRDTAGGVSNDRADPEPEESRKSEVQGAADDHAGDAGFENDSEMSRPNKVWPARIDCAEKNAISVAGTLTIRVIVPETPALAHRQAAVRDGDKRRADHPGRVFAGDHEHAKHPDRQLRHADADQGRLKGLKASLSWRLIVDQRTALITAGMIAKTMVAAIPTTKV